MHGHGYIVSNLSLALDDFKLTSKTSKDPAK
jgi:hypothetical protein